MKKPDQWVAMRNRGLGAKTERSFEGIFWDPQTIYSGQAIELNVSEVQRILATIRAKKEIHLAAMTSSAKNNDISIQGTQLGGELAASKFSSKKLKPQGPDVSGILNSDSAYSTIKLDFKGHAAAAEDETNADSLSDEFFSNINDDFIEGLRLVIMDNYMQLSKNSEQSTGWDKGLGVETASEIAVFLMFCLSFPLLALSILGSHDIGTVLQSSLLVSLYFSYGIRQTFVIFSIFAFAQQRRIPTEEKNFIARNGEYIVEQAVKGNLLPLLILDQRTAEVWHFPLIMSFIRKPKYFRRAGSDTKKS